MTRLSDTLIHKHDAGHIGPEDVANLPRQKALRLAMKSEADEAALKVFEAVRNVCIAAGLFALALAALQCASPAPKELTSMDYYR